MEERRKYLLGREEVKPDKPDSRGQTPLPHAARSRFKDVVEIFLEREVYPDNPDNHSGTPLSHPVEKGK